MEFLNYGSSSLLVEYRTVAPMEGVQFCQKRALPLTMQVPPVALLKLKSRPDLKCGGNENETNP